MEKTEYSKHLEKARQNQSLKKISKTYMKEGDIFQGIDFNSEYILLNNLLNLLEERGIAYEDVENILVEYSGTIHELYTQIGIKVGANLEIENINTR